MLEISYVTKEVTLKEDLDDPGIIVATRMNNMIIQNSVFLNEAFPTLLCGNIIAALTQFMNDQHPREDGRKSFQFRVLPVLKEAKDKRKSQKSDYVIIRLINEKTILLIELKRSVGNPLSEDDNDNLAQLFYEAIVVHRNEEKEKLFCVYSNSFTWHIFEMNMSLAKPKCSILLAHWQQ